jgi:hypothetical protein
METEEPEVLLVSLAAALLDGRQLPQLDSMAAGGLETQGWNWTSECSEHSCSLKSLQEQVTGVSTALFKDHAICGVLMLLSGIIRSNAQLSQVALSFGGDGTMLLSQVARHSITHAAGFLASVSGSWIHGLLAAWRSKVGNGLPGARNTRVP